MYVYPEPDLQDLLKWLDELGSQKQQQDSTPAKSAAQADPVKPTYYPQPDVFTYAKAHGLDPIEFSVVKYITRWRKKNGLEDLKKARRCLDILIEEESKKPGTMKAGK